LFGNHEKSYENHGAAPGHLFNRESMHFFDFVFPHHLGITKIHMKIMGQHLVVFSIEIPCISLTLFFHIIWASGNSYENHGAAPGHHFKIRRLTLHTDF
jgi:hypothetical protein